MRTLFRPFPLIALLLLPLPTLALDSNPFFAFQNGVRFASHEDAAKALAKFGYDGIGSASFPRDGDIPSLVKTYQTHGLKVFSFYTGGRLTEQGGEPAAGLYEAIPQLNGSSITLEVYLQGNRTIDQDEKAVKWIRDLSDRAAQSGLQIVLYPHTNFYIETIGDAVRVAKKVDRDNVGVMFNLCHFLKIEPGSDLRSALLEAKPLLRQVSVSGADEGGTDWRTLIQPVGKGSYDMTPLLQALREIEFTGPIGAQCFNIQGDSKVFLKQTAEAWKALTQ